MALEPVTPPRAHDKSLAWLPRAWSCVLAWLAARSLTFELLGSSAVEVLQRETDLVLHVRSARRLGATTAAAAESAHAAAEEVGEDVCGTGHSRHRQAMSTAGTKKRQWGR